MATYSVILDNPVIIYETFNPAIPIGQVVCSAALGDPRVRPHLVSVYCDAVRKLSNGQWHWFGTGENGYFYSAVSGGRISHDRLHTLAWSLDLGQSIPDDVFKG